MYELSFVQQSSHDRAAITNARLDVAVGPNVCWLPPPMINMKHIELSYHFIMYTFGATWIRGSVTSIVRDVLLEHAVVTPLLTHQVLAFSALNLSKTVPAQGLGVSWC